MGLRAIIQTRAGVCWREGPRDGGGGGGGNRPEPERRGAPLRFLKVDYYFNRRGCN